MTKRLDPDRVGRMHGRTGIYVRAKHDCAWGTYDIAELDAPSLLEWLRSRGGANEWAENVVGMLLGHETLHETEER